MKKVIVVAALLALVVSLFAGCGEKKSVDNGTAESTAKANTVQNAEKRELNILGSVRRFPDEEQAWNDVIKKFEEENNAKVNVRWQGQWNEIPQNLAAAKMAGEKVDIFTAGAGVINSTLARSGSLMDITDLMAPLRDRFTDGMLAPFTIGDRLWGFPYGDGDSSAVYYNVDMFKELGLSVPKTFDELVTVSKVIKEKKNITPMVHQGKAVWFWPMWYFEAYAQTSGNQSIENVREFLAGKKEFTGQAEKDAFLKIKQFFDTGVLSTESLDTDGDGMRAAFAQQKAAMFYGGTWEYAPTQSIVKDFEIGIFEFPLLVDTAGVKALHGGGPGDAIIIPSFADQKNLDLTMKFIEFILRPENANTILSKYNPMVSVVKGVQVQDTPLIQKLNKEVVPNTIMFLDWIWPVEVNDAFNQCIPAVVSGHMSADEAVENVQNAYKTLIKEKEYSFDWWTKWTKEDWAKVTPEKVPDPTK